MNFVLIGGILPMPRLRFKRPKGRETDAITCGNYLMNVDQQLYFSEVT